MAIVTFLIDWLGHLPDLNSWMVSHCLSISFDSFNIFWKTFYDTAPYRFSLCTTYCNTFHSFAILNHFQLPTISYFFTPPVLFKWCLLLPEYYFAFTLWTLSSQISLSNLGVIFQVSAHLSSPLLILCPLCCAFWGLCCDICHMKSWQFACIYVFPLYFMSPRGQRLYLQTSHSNWYMAGDQSGWWMNAKGNLKKTDFLIKGHSFYQWFYESEKC